MLRPQGSPGRPHNEFGVDEHNMPQFHSVQRYRAVLEYQHSRPSRCCCRGVPQNFVASSLIFGNPMGLPHLRHWFAWRSVNLKFCISARVFSSRSNTSWQYIQGSAVSNQIDATSHAPVLFGDAATKLFPAIFIAVEGICGSSFALDCASNSFVAF